MGFTCDPHLRAVSGSGATSKVGDRHGTGVQALALCRMGA
jgi:hypothetical protein